MNSIPKITTRVMMPDPVEVSIARHLAEIDHREAREDYIEQQASIKAQAIVDDLTGDELAEAIGEMSPTTLNVIAKLLVKDPLAAACLLREATLSYWTEEMRKSTRRALEGS